MLLLTAFMIQSPGVVFKSHKGVGTGTAKTESYLYLFSALPVTYCYFMV